MKDYYKILGVDARADKASIKKAYRKLAQRYHPDRNQGDKKAEEAFKEITEAYSTLSDPESRKRYDLERSNPSFLNLNSFGDFADIFSAAFGSNAFDFDNRPKKPKVKKEEPLINIKLKLSELNSFTSTKKTLRIKQNIKCSYCDGKGGDSVTRCATCSGLGSIQEKYKQGTILFQNSSPCTVCAGRGVIVNNQCAVCAGSGTNQTTDIYDLEITSKKRR